MDSLITQHNDRLHECEKAIAAEMRKVAGAIEKCQESIAPYIQEVKERKLYAPRYGSFGEWRRDIIGKSDRFVRYVLAEHKVKTLLADAAVQPGNRSARELSRLPADQQVAAWEELTADGEAPAVAAVRDKVDKISGGITFDPDEIENYKPPKNGSPKVNQKRLKKLLAMLDDLSRGLAEFGLYERNIESLSSLRRQIVETA